MRVSPVCRFVNPSNRGSLAVSMLLLYVLMGVPAGYCSSVLYKSFKGRKWQQCTLLTALLFPSMCFTVFLSLNFMSQRYHSTQVIGGFDELNVCTSVSQNTAQQLVVSQAFTQLRVCGQHAPKPEAVQFCVFSILL